MITLEEKIKIKKSQIFLEALTVDDIKKMAEVFNQIETITQEFDLSEIDRVLNASRKELYILIDKTRKQGVASKAANYALGLIGQSPEDKKKRAILGSLLVTQTSLVKLIRSLPDILSVSKSKYSIKSEATAKELAGLLGTNFQEIQTRANALAGSRVVRDGNSQVPKEIEAGLRQSLEKGEDNPSMPKQLKTNSEPKTKQDSNLESSKTLSKVLGPEGSKFFYNQVKNVLNIKGILGDLKNTVASYNKSIVPDPHEVAKDLLLMDPEEFNSLVSKSKQYGDLQVGISKEAAKEISTSVTDVKTGETDTKTSIKNDVASTAQGRVVSPTDIVSIWSEYYPRLTKKTLLNLANSISGYTVGAKQAVRPKPEK